MKQGLSLLSAIALTIPYISACSSDINVSNAPSPNFFRNLPTLAKMEPDPGDTLFQ